MLKTDGIPSYVFDVGFLKNLSGVSDVKVLKNLFGLCTKKPACD